MKNWFVVEEKSWGQLVAFHVPCSLTQSSLLQLNEPSPLSLSWRETVPEDCPWQLSFPSCTEGSRTGLGIPGGINSGRLNIPHESRIWSSCRPALGFEHCLTGGKPQRKKQWELFLLLGCLNSFPQAREAKACVFTRECFCLSFGTCDNSAEANFLTGNASCSLLWGFLYLIFCLYSLFPEKWTHPIYHPTEIHCEH